MEDTRIQQYERLVQLQHPEKLLPFASRLDDSLTAAILGLDSPTYQTIKQRFDQRARTAAQELLTDPSFAARVDRLPFTPRATIIGLGDTNTDDLQSWLEILRQLLELCRNEDRIRVINAGVFGQTTAMALRGFSSIVGQQPAWIICMLGSADALRIGTPPVKQLVSLDETIKNLEALRQSARHQSAARWVWLTPPPVDEQLAASYPPFRQAQMTLRNADLSAISDFLRGQTDPVVDTQAVFGTPVTARFLQPDSPTPSLAGQQAIVKALVERLTASTSPTP